MAKNTASSNQIGLPLATPSKQTILPVFCGGNGNLKGFFTIASTTFAGTERTFTLTEGVVAINTVTLPPKLNDGHQARVSQYMAVIYPDNQLSLKPWLGYSGFVPNDAAGWSRIFYNPADTWMIRFNAGILYTNLTVNMAAQAWSAPSGSNPSVTNGAMSWKATVPYNSTQLECGFFDFNWVNLFQAQSTSSVDPLSISTVSNPVSGQFKSTVVPSPVTVPGGGVQFNTVRIIMLSPAGAGAYTFTFQVKDTANRTTNVTFTLTII